MDLWIRSQSGNILCKAQTLSVGINAFQKWSVFNGCDELGHYGNEERALEILDEIQNLLMPRIIYNPPVYPQYNPYYQTPEQPIVQNGSVKYEEVSTYVYKMPKE